MGFNEFLSSIFGNKSTRDMKEIQPWVDKIKAAYPEVAKLDNDALRAKTEELKRILPQLRRSTRQGGKLRSCREARNTDLSGTLRNKGSGKSANQVKAIIINIQKDIDTLRKNPWNRRRRVLSIRKIRQR